MIVGEEVTGAVTRPSINGIAYGVGEGFEDRVDPRVMDKCHIRSIVSMAPKRLR
jgi:hypothetical protein